MFKWFGSSKKEENEEKELEIPTPPPPNIDVALRVRKGNYNPLYYTHPEDLNEEINSAFQKREDRIKDVKKFIPALSIEIVDEYIDRQHRSIAKIHFSSMLKKHIPLQYIKRFQRKQYRIKHKYLMYQIIRELNVAYRNGLIVKSNKLDHQLSMIALEHEIKAVYYPEVEKQIHQLHMCNMREELIEKATQISSFIRDKKLYQLYMRMLKKDILFNHRKYLEIFASKQDQKYFMNLVMNELIQKKKDIVEDTTHRNMVLVLEELKDKREEIEEIYEDFQDFQEFHEKYDANFSPINKHLKVLSEDIDFMQWGTIDPFIVVPEIQDMDVPFFQDNVEYCFIENEKQNQAINIECDFTTLFPESEKNDLKKEKSEDEKMEEGKVEKYREGYMKILLGSMFSGKSSHLLFELSCMADQRFCCLYINHVKDERKTESQDKFVTTHNSSYSKMSSKISCIKVSNLGEVNVKDFDYIAIDELQFFDNDNTVSTILDWVKQGKYVLIASLDGDAYRRKFGKVLDLLPHADKVKKLTAYCDMCRDNYGRLKPAPFTARMTSDTSAELVGGADLYKAMCRECHDFHLDVTVRKY